MARKTIKEWLESIEDENIKKQALTNMSDSVKGIAVDNIPKALISGFDWSESPEGITYWVMITEKELSKLSNK